jgi:hypothetical protein
MARTIRFKCGACGTVHYVPRALVLDCPVAGCKAEPGAHCRDLRSNDPDARRVTPHPEREALLP